MRGNDGGCAWMTGVVRGWWWVVFESFARDEASELSDIDVLVTFDGPATSRGFFGVQFFIEDIFDRSVDLVTDNALREEFRPYVEQDAIKV